MLLYWIFGSILFALLALYWIFGSILCVVAGQSLFLCIESRISFKSHHAGIFPWCQAKWQRWLCSRLNQFNSWAAWSFTLNNTNIIYIYINTYVYLFILFYIVYNLYIYNIYIYTYVCIYCMLISILRYAPEMTISMAILLGYSRKIRIIGFGIVWSMLDNPKGQLFVEDHDALIH